MILKNDCTHTNTISHQGDQPENGKNGGRSGSSIVLQLLNDVGGGLEDKNKGLSPKPNFTLPTYQTNKLNSGRYYSIHFITTND